MLTLAVVVALLALDAGGSPEIRWSAPPACAEVTEVRARIEALLGRPLADTDLEIAGVIEASPPDAWALELTLGRPGEVTRRRLVAARCSTLVDAAALLVAVLVDPVAAASALAWASAGQDAPRKDAPRQDAPGETALAVEGPRRVGDAAAASAGVEEEVAESNENHQINEINEINGIMAEVAIAGPEPEAGAEALAARPRPRSRRRWALGLGLAGGVELGALPGPAGAVQAAVVADRRRLRLALTGSFMPPRRRALAAPAGASLRVLQGAAGLRACARLVRGRLSAPLCAGLEVGAQEGAGEGVLEARRARSLWLAALLAPSLAWSPRPGVDLVLGAEIAAPIVRPRFLLAAEAPEDDIVVHTAAPISGRLLGGLVIMLRRPR